MIGARQIKVGMILNHENGLYRVMSVSLIAPGNWRAFVQTKLRNIVTGSQTEVRFRAEDSVDRAHLDTRNVEYLYPDGDVYHFMDTKSYEQFPLTKEILGDAVNYLTPNLKLVVEMYENRPVGIDLPQTVALKVVETDPFMKSATVTNQFKPAKVETGATFQVPGFIAEGETVEIDTSTGEYVGRAK